MEQYLTIIPLLAAGASIVYYLMSLKKEEYLRPARTFFLFGFYSVVILYAYFLYLIFSHQYQYTYVWSYSSNNLSAPLLLSTSYAGQEGSLFLWLFYTAVISLFVLRYSRRHKYESVVIPIILLFEVFVLAILTLKSPFIKIWDSFPGTPVGSLPPDGRGLNPLLQNFWIVIHPPILFLGFASAVVPFAYAVAGLLKKDYSAWTGYLQPWLVLNVLTLGAGIIIGGYWAYVTLGWGGFWGWDPVENSSLIPWLFSAAALHTVIVARRTKAYLKTSLVFVIISFVLVLYSTFLTRSGVLGDTSVHAFVDPGKSVYIVLLVLIGTFTVLGFVPFFRNMKLIPSAGVSHKLLSRENALFVGAASLSVLSLFVLVGTSSPIITGLLQGKPTAVDSSYYVTTSLPLGLLIIALIGFGQLVWWDRSDKRAFARNISVPAGVGILAALAALLLSVTNVSAIIIISVAAFAFTAHVSALLRIVRGNPRYIGGPIAHAGLALMFIGIVGSTALESKVTVQLPEGKPVKVFGQDVTYNGNTKVDGKDGFKVTLTKGATTVQLNPVMYYSEYNQGTMREPDIKSYLAYDIYVSPMALENGSSGNLGASGVGVVTVEKGKPTRLADGTSLTLKKFDMNTAGHSAMEQGGSFGVGAVIEATKDGRTIEVIPSLSFTGGKQTAVPATAFGNMIVIMSMNVGMGGPGSQASVNLAVHSGGISQAAVPVLTAEISRKPLIGFLWAGTITLFLGLLISLYRRFTEESAARRMSSPNSADPKSESRIKSKNEINSSVEVEHEVQENVES